MRHGKKFNHLGRKKAHREAMLKNMAGSLIIHKRIFTTTAKAKALRVYVEPLITKAKENTTHNRRIVFGYLQSNEAVSELFTNIAAKVADRPGGYTRILKTHNRLGDNADMCMMELVDFNELMLEAKAKSTKSSGKKRTRRGKKSTTDTKPKEVEAKKVEAEVEVEAEVKAEEAAPVVEAAAEVVEEATKEVEAEVEVEAKEEPKVEEVKEETPEAPAAEADDLTKIEGVGPKIAEVLTNGGLSTFALVAASNADAMKAMLEAAEGNFGSHDPGTWAEQAKMAADGKWDELKKWQDELDGGKPAE